MDMETNRVWDYAGDGYVHRLIQNNDDGKLVEMSERQTSDKEKSGSEDHLINLFMSQLESQREWYEGSFVRLMLFR